MGGTGSQVHTGTKLLAGLETDFPDGRRGIQDVWRVIGWTNALFGRSFLHQLVF